MNTYVVALACLLAVAHANPIGLGPIWAPAAVSTANLVKAAPIPIIRTVGVPVVVSSPVVKSIGWGGLGPIGPLGVGGLGPIGPLGVSGLGLGGLGWNAGLGGLGWNGVGLGGVGLKGGHGWH